MDHQSLSTENSLSSLDSKVTASLSSVDSEVTANLELIFPTAVRDRIKRCISLYKARHSFDLWNRNNPAVMTQWCVERFLDNDPELDNNDVVAGDDISITKYEPSKDVMVTGFSSGDEKTVDASSTESLKSGIKSLASDRSVVLNKMSDSSCTSISDKSDLIEGTKQTSDINNTKDLKSPSHELTSDVNNTKDPISPVTSSDKSLPTPSYLKSVSTSFDISRNDTYSSTILDSSSEDSRDSVVSQEGFSEEDLPAIPFPKKANTSIGSLFSKPQSSHRSTTASSSQSSFSVTVSNSLKSAMKRPSWASDAGNGYLNSKSTITRPPGSAHNSLSSATSSLSSAYSSPGSTNRKQDPAHSSPSSIHRPTGSAYSSPSSAHRSTGPALSSPSSAHRPTGPALSSPSSFHRPTGPALNSPSSAHKPTGPAHSSPSSAHRPFGSPYSSPSSAHRSTGPAHSSPSSAHSSSSSAHKPAGSPYNSTSAAHNSHGSAHRPFDSAYNSTSSAHRPTSPVNNSPSSGHTPLDSAYNSTSSAHRPTVPAHRPTGSAHSSTFKLSPSKFNFTQKIPGKAVPSSTFQPNTITSSCVLTTTPEFSSVTTSPMATHSRLSSLNSSTRTEQTITIQSTHHITCSSSKNSASPSSHENIPVVTEITTPGPKISVKLNRLTEETIGEYQPDRHIEDKMKHDDNRFNIGCQIKCGHCSKCKDDNVMKEPSLHPPSISNNNNNNILVHTIPTYVNAADQYFKDVYDDTRGHDAGFPDSSKSTDPGFKEDQVYFVTNRFGKREAMLYKNGGLIPYGQRNGTKPDIHGFIEGHTYKIACEGQKPKEMVWLKGKLRSRREMIQRYHAERRQEQENETKRMLDVLARSRQKIADIEPTVPLVNFGTWRERRESLVAHRKKEQDPNHLNPVQNLTEKSSVSKTKHVRFADGANLLENEDLENDDSMMNNDNILDLTEDITEITNNDNNTVNEIQPVEVIDDEKRVKNEVLELFPDVDIPYLDDLCSQHTGPMAVNNICLALLDSKYPKSATSAAKTDTSSKSVEKKQYIDYYTHPSFNVMSEYLPEFAAYRGQTFYKLSSEFRWIPAQEIRFVLNQRKYYAPAHRELSNIWKIPANAVKNASPSSRGILKGFTFEFEIETKSGQKVKREMKLLKNRRPAIVSNTLGLVPELKEEIAFVEQKIQESAVEEDYKVACYMNEQEYETEGQCIECGCCYMECPFESMVQCYEGHLFCETCLKQYAREAIFGQGKADLKCMTDLCDSSFPHSQLEKALPSDILVKYEDRCTEESLNLADLGDLVKCPFCDFRACLDSDSRVFMCQNPGCKKESCRHCQSDWKDHFGKKCSEVEKKDETKLRVEYEEKMTKAKVRVCHRCKAQFTKEDGCNKMTCRCGAKQCYICRKPDIDYNHFCGHPRDPGKLCTKCISCSLWTNPDEDDNRAIAELQKAGEEEKRLKGFTCDTVIGVPDEPPVKKQKVDNK
ncbi:hypothetical protein ACF0H5_000515 [Mactra antiquata]